VSFIRVQLALPLNLPVHILLNFKLKSKFLAVFTSPTRILLY